MHGCHRKLRVSAATSNKKVQGYLAQVTPNPTAEAASEHKHEHEQERSRKQGPRAGAGTETAAAATKDCLTGCAARVKLQLDKWKEHTCTLTHSLANTLTHTQSNQHTHSVSTTTRTIGVTSSSNIKCKSTKVLAAVLLVVRVYPVKREEHRRRVFVAR